MAETLLYFEPRREREYYARSAEAHGVTSYVDLRRPRSNFDLVETEYEGLTTLRRILSQVRQRGGCTAVIDELGEPGEIREENEDVRLRFPDFTPSKLRRIGFFTKSFSLIEVAEVIKSACTEAKHGCIYVYGPSKKFRFTFAFLKGLNDLGGHINNLIIDT